MTLILRLVAALTITFSLSALAQSAPDNAASAKVDQGLLIIKNLVNGKTGQADSSSCRPEGYRCRNSLECCGFCNNGVCGSGGGNSCRPDGAVCRNSLECCGFCYDGVCGNGGGNSCREAGLACRNSTECCNFCHDNVCN